MPNRSVPEARVIQGGLLGREGGAAKTCPTKVGNFQAMQREFFSEEMRNEDSRYIHDM